MTKRKKGKAVDEEARSTKELLTYDSVFTRREFEEFIRQTDLPRLITERFCQNQYVGEGSEGHTRLAKEYLSANLSEAIYIITGLTLLKAHYYATSSEPLRKSVFNAWNAETLKQLKQRDTKLLLRSGKGPQRQWDAEELLRMVRWTVRELTNPSALSLPNVAKAINQGHPGIHLTADSLRQLLRRKRISWKKLKADRTKEIKKRT